MKQWDWPIYLSLSVPKTLIHPNTTLSFSKFWYIMANVGSSVEYLKACLGFRVIFLLIFGWCLSFDLLDSCKAQWRTLGFGGSVMSFPWRYRYVFFCVSYIEVVSGSTVKLFQVVLISTLDELYTYVQPTQLPPEFGGCFDYDHRCWMKNRMVSTGPLLVELIL